MPDQSQEDRKAYRARIRAMSPDARAALAEIMRHRLGKIPAEIARLQEEQQQLTEWLAEFAPGGEQA